MGLIPILSKAKSTSIFKERQPFGLPLFLVCHSDSLQEKPVLKLPLVPRCRGGGLA